MKKSCERTSSRPRAKLHATMQSCASKTFQRSKAQKPHCVWLSSSQIIQLDSSSGYLMCCTCGHGTLERSLIMMISAYGLYIYICSNEPIMPTGKPHIVPGARPQHAKAMMEECWLEPPAQKGFPQTPPQKVFGPCGTPNNSKNDTHTSVSYVEGKSIQCY